MAELPRNFLCLPLLFLSSLFIHCDDTAGEDTADLARGGGAVAQSEEKTGSSWADAVPCSDGSDVLHSRSCPVEGVRCLAEPGCCECVNTYGCGLFWNCASLGFGSSRCPSAPPPQDDPCSTPGQICGYCVEEGPVSFSCSSSSGGWVKNVFEMDCP